ncbi:MAG: NAD-dependent epimerase/dehydratase family protein, partial [Candidatus Omnitrophota bacterium]
MSDYKKYYQGKKILVTGGAGAIGSNLVRGLCEAGAKIVFILDDFSSSHKWNVPALPNVLLVEGSILDEVKVKRVFFEKPDCVFHLAA